MTGGSSFNEVFLCNVHVPDSNRLGELNDGWRVVTSLAEERARIRNGPIGQSAEHFRRVLELARRHQSIQDPLVRDRLARLATCGWATQLLGQRITDCAGPAGADAELALTKLALSANQALRSEVVCEILGSAVCADPGVPEEWEWVDFVLSVPAVSIAGGMDEIVRNLLGERVLNLPKEPGPDPRTPFVDRVNS
jgi:alkylation response protein AidB-like acyl-CoA dehydrogenase